MKIEQQLTNAVIEAVKALYGQDITAAQVALQKTKKEFEGHLTLVVFGLSRISHKKPEDTAQEIGQWLKDNTTLLQGFNVVKGFLNLVIAPAQWIGLLNDIDANAEYGITHPTADSPLVMIEYSSPNTNKPLHLGHVRNNLLGWALAGVIEANGNRVVKTNIVNDRGIHICKSMLAWLKYGNGETPESSGKKGDHLIGDYYVAFDKHYRAEVKELQAKFEAEGMTADDAKAKAEKESPLIKEAHAMLVKWEAGDPEVRALWRKMNEWVYAGFDETYKALGVSFDKIYYESDTYLVGKQAVEEGLNKGLFFRKEDGSVWADLTKDGLDEKLLLRADGTAAVSFYTAEDGTRRSANRDVTEKTAALADEIAALTLTACVDYDPAEGAAAVCGLDTPEVTLTVNYLADNSAERTLILAVGLSTGDGRRYVALDGDTTIYRMEESSLTQILTLSETGL